MSFKLEHQKKFGSIETKLYSYKEKNNALNNYIKSKLEKPTQNFHSILENYGDDNLNKEALLKKYQELSIPKSHLIPAFDVKRSTVTEFMAEFLLEQVFQCIFFEQSNKKINKAIIDTDRHSTGIDVVGIQEKDEDLKFVLAEIKASKADNIPCSSAENLKTDIKNILDFANNRLIKEIFNMSENLKNEEHLKKYITFLLDLIQNKNAPRILVERVIIFPFLIRQNSKILKQSTLQDFEKFSELDTKEIETIGIVWAINKNIDDFVKSFYSND